MHFVSQIAVSCGGSQLIFIPPIHFVLQTAVSCRGSQLISIPPMHFVFQIDVRCGGSQLIERGTRVANLGDFPPNNENLGTLKVFWESEDF
jgi:hypothetical protein